MASTRDAQDILNLKQTDAAARSKKKGQKPKLVRPAHIPKEVWLLETQGDRAPPVALTAIQPKKPKLTRRVKPWELQSFTHSNRQDGLVLHHWRRKETEAQANGPATPADGTVASAADIKADESETKTDLAWAKYNVKVDVPEFTQEQYDKHLVAVDWSKEETEYLISVVQDFDLRWVVIADRYEYKPSAPDEDGDNAVSLVPAAKPRTMEDLKARYYKVASAMMAVKQPLASMTQAEFSFHEKMTKFDGSKEAKRKRMAEQLLERTDQEIEEEKRLLAELKRIVTDEDDFISERAELYDRLAAPTTRGGGISAYENSAGLSQLGQQLAAQDRSRSRQYQLQQQQRRQIAGLDDKDKLNSPAAPPTAGLQRGASDMRRSLDEPPTGRKDSKAGQHTFTQRKLSNEEKRTYGVQNPDKLLTGERIRHVRIERRVTARASSVAAKVQDTMLHLDIPIKPIMATQKITEGYEQLCASLDLLLDSKRITDKIENEIKVLKAQKEARETTLDGQDDGAGDAKSQHAAQNNVGGEPKSAQNAENEEESANPDTHEAEKEDEEHEDDDEAEDQENAEADDDDEEDGVKPNSDDDEADEAEVEDDAEEDADEDTPDDAGDGEEDETLNVDDEDDVEDSRPSTRASRKRSVSVLSSAPSQKSTKRQRK